MIRKIFKKNKQSKNSFVEPDEIFLDSKNIQNFDHQQFEGRIERPIPKQTAALLGGFFLIITLVFGARLSYLEVEKGEAYLERSENNTLEKKVIFADRGIIYDRNKRELAWNRKNDDASLLYTRAYLSPGFSHVLGYVSYPAKDSAGYYWQTEFMGKDGLEKEYDNKLRGENGSKIIEVNALGEIHSENIINAPKQGPDLITSMDARIQGQLFAFIKNLSENNSFAGGAGVMMNVRNGEIIASTSFPEYSSEILSIGKDETAINSYITDKRKFFLDRNVSGLYTPGSIVKPFLALGALNEGIINPSKKILSTGSISIPNPYFPNQETVFKDWKIHGWTDMAEALAVSSDVYFYTVGGGLEGQKGMGIANIEKYAKLFGIGRKTGVDLPDETLGVIPSPQWKLENFKGDPWRIGDTYHTAIGQYGFQVTPIEMVRAVGAIANFGKLLTPHFILSDGDIESQFSMIDFKKEYFDVVHRGMRQAVTNGTAQLGVAKNRVNSWVVGFFPYENPEYAFTIMMESGPSGGASANSIMRELLDWMYWNTPEYF